MKIFHPPIAVTSKTSYQIKAYTTTELELCSNHEEEFRLFDLLPFAVL